MVSILSIRWTILFFIFEEKEKKKLTKQNTREILITLLIITMVWSSLYWFIYLAIRYAISALNCIIVQLWYHGYKTHDAMNES